MHASVRIRTRSLSVDVFERSSRECHDFPRFWSRTWKKKHDWNHLETVANATDKVRRIACKRARESCCTLYTYKFSNKIKWLNERLFANTFSTTFFVFCKRADLFFPLQEMLLLKRSLHFPVGSVMVYFFKDDFYDWPRASVFFEMQQHFSLRFAGKRRGATFAPLFDISAPNSKELFNFFLVARWQTIFRRQLTLAAEVEVAVWLRRNRRPRNMDEKEQETTKLKEKRDI